MIFQYLFWPNQSEDCQSIGFIFKIQTGPCKTCIFPDSGRIFDIPAVTKTNIGNFTILFKKIVQRLDMKLESVKFDCTHYRGHIPCTPNKQFDVRCDNCSHYQSVDKKILIIKLGAIGDVIRTTPLLKKYKSMYPGAQFTWITLYPDVLPKADIHALYRMDAIGIFNVSNTTYDIAINLDKDPEACLLLNQVEATEKYGFAFSNGHLAPATPKAAHKILTGLFDDLSKVNKKSYLEEIFEICHLDFNYEEYSIRRNSELGQKWSQEMQERAQGKTIIGLNTGCGDRWKTRLWPAESWILLIRKLQEAGYYPVVLGGKAEDEMNRFYAAETGVYYPGYFSLEEFIELTASCDLIVTQVSLMMHIAIALQKTLILFNNIFNPHEFELYKRGILMQPSSGCDCYFGNTCKRSTSCMNDLDPNRVFAELTQLVPTT